MRLLSYKKMRNGTYRVLFDEGTSMDLYEDVILQYDLLLHKEIEKTDLLKMKKDNEMYDTYFVALKALKMRLRSKKELTTYLEKKEYPRDCIESALEKLEEQGYLDDLNYAYAYVHEQMITTTKGPLRLRLDLLQKQISEKAISEALKDYGEEMELEKIHKIINRMKKQNRNRGGYVLKKKVTDFLLQQGFSFSLVHQEINVESWEMDEAIAKKEYEKLYRTLSSKYSGYELERRIQAKLYQKGLSYKED